MADHIDEATAFTEAHLDRSLAAVRASGVAGTPHPGTCEACCDEDVPVLHCGGMPRCTPCRAKWQSRS